MDKRCQGNHSFHISLGLVYEALPIFTFGKKFANPGKVISLPPFRIVSRSYPILSGYSATSTRDLSVSLRRATGLHAARDAARPGPSGSVPGLRELKMKLKRANEPLDPVACKSFWGENPLLGTLYNDNFGKLLSGHNFSPAWEKCEVSMRKASVPSANLLLSHGDRHPAIQVIPCHDLSRPQTGFAICFPDEVISFSDGGPLFSGPAQLSHARKSWLKTLWRTT